MKFKLYFIKENDKWYADVPNVSKEEREMVFGADTFLDNICNGAKEIRIQFSDTTEDDDIQLYHFVLFEHDEFGGTYRNSKNPKQIFWLCNVTHNVCVEHPAEIFINEIIRYIYKNEE